MNVTLPNGFVIEGVPQGTSKEDIMRKAISAGLATQQDFGVIDDFVPTEERLAETAGFPDETERTLGETLTGLGETALTAATGATTGAAGFIGGAIQGLVGEATGELETGEGLQKAQEMASKFTYQPRTEAGKEFVGELGEALEVLPPVLGAGPSGVSTGTRSALSAAKSIEPVLGGKAKLAKTIVTDTAKNVKQEVTDVIDLTLKDLKLKDSSINNPVVKQKVIAEEIKKGNPDVELVTKQLNEKGEVVTNPIAKKALKELGGGDSAIATISVLERMNQPSKAQVGKMLDVIEKGRKNPIYGDTNRPSDILGDSIASRAKTVTSLNKGSGERIGKIAESLKNKKVDISEPRNKFRNSLEKLGVTFDVGEDGFITPNFSRSKFVGGSQKDMNVLVNDLVNDNIGFKSAHELKRSIRDNIDFDKFGPSQIKGQSQKILKDLSSEIDGILDKTSPAYKKANEEFAKTVKLKDEFDKLTGKDIELTGEMSAQVLGGKARRLASNAESRSRIQQTLMNVDKVLGEFGIKYKDDIPSLTHIVNKLEDEFKIAPSRSFQGEVAKANVSALAATGTTGAAMKLADIAASKILQLSQPSFEKKMKALRALTNQKKIKQKKN